MSKPGFLARSLPLLVALGASGAAAAPLSIDEIRSDDGDCATALDPLSTVVDTDSCNVCREYIEDYAKPEDKAVLLAELNAKECKDVVEAFPEPRISGWSLFMDQDAIVFDDYTGLNHDRNYTLGLGFSITGADTKKVFLADWRDWVDEKLQMFPEDADKNTPLEHTHSFDFGMTAFTPGDLEEEDPIPGDRPFAAMLYISSARQTAYEAGHAIKSRLVLGVMGTAFPGNLQRYLHNDLELSKKDPRGWHNQISDGGELTGLYAVEGTKLMMDIKEDWYDFDMSFSASGSIGYYTDAAFGLDIRFGRINSPYYAHSANPLSSYNHGNCVSTCRSDDSFLFFSYRTRIVLYNVFLQGQFRDSELEFEAGEIDRWLHEFGVGYTRHVLKGFQMTYALNYRSPEFFGAERRSHWWGGLTFSWNFDPSENTTSEDLIWPFSQTF